MRILTGEFLLTTLPAAVPELPSRYWPVHGTPRDRVALQALRASRSGEVLRKVLGMLGAARDRLLFREPIR